MGNPSYFLTSHNISCAIFCQSQKVTIQLTISDFLLGLRCWSETICCASGHDTQLCQRFMHKISSGVSTDAIYKFLGASAKRTVRRLKLVMPYISQFCRWKILTEMGVAYIRRFSSIQRTCGYKDIRIYFCPDYIATCWWTHVIFGGWATGASLLAPTRIKCWFIVMVMVTLSKMYLDGHQSATWGWIGDTFFSQPQGNMGNYCTKFLLNQRCRVQI